MVEKEKKKNRKESKEKREKKNFNGRLTDLAKNSLTDLISHSHIVIDMFFLFFFLFKTGCKTKKQEKERGRERETLLIYFCTEKARGRRSPSIGLR